MDMMPDSNEVNIEDFINFDHDFHSPSSVSPATSKMLPNQPMINRRPAFISNPIEQSRHQYSGPSHDYGQWRQQTGLPSGALNQVGSARDTQRAFDASQVNPDFEFRSRFDLDTGMSSEPTAFYNPVDSMSNEDFIDPTVIDGQFQPPTVTRAYPGMHSQQAEQARASALARQKEQRQGSSQAPPQQLLLQQLPQDFQQTFANSHSRSGSDASDIQVDDRISQLLSQIRHNSAGSIPDGDEDMDGESSHGGLSKKALEDMDEDERLLASEEGKKLTSKERRQLRNKVSARAFRSRRKEYISQLEGEVNAKQDEVAELKTRNRTLLAQNQQLTKLAQTMLHHPAFRTFMEDVSQDPLMLDRLDTQTQVSTSTSQPSGAAVKQESSSTRPQSRNPAIESSGIHAGMAMLPEYQFEFDQTNLGHTHFQPAHSGVNPAMFGGFQSQVFSVTSLPTPKLDLTNLSGKHNDETQEEGDDAKLTSPVFDDEWSLPAPAAEAPAVAERPVSLEKTDAAYDLYCNAPSPMARSEVGSRDDFASDLSSKSSHFQLKLANPATRIEDEAHAIESVDAMFASMENGPMKRIERLMGNYRV